MNSNLVKNSIRFLGLVFLQILIFNNIYFLGYINPAIYIAFVLLYPLKKERGSFLFLSFLIGLTIDIFSNTGGVNAAATLFIAYIRISILNFILRKNDYDYILFKLKSLSLIKIFSFIFILTFIHQFIIYSLESFYLKDILSSSLKALYASIFSSIILFFSIQLFSKKK